MPCRPPDARTRSGAASLPLLRYRFVPTRSGLQRSRRGAAGSCVVMDAPFVVVAVDAGGDAGPLPIMTAGSGGCRATSAARQK